mgnify:CR=1 FL=1
MRAIYMKEIRSYFKNPLGYIFIGAILAMFGIYYSIYTLYLGYSDYGSNVLKSAMGLIVYFLPLLTMRTFSEEMKNRTDQLLLTAPVRTWQIVLGKFLAAMTVLGIALLLTAIQPLTTIFGYQGDVGAATVFGGYLGTFLMAAALISIGMLISSMTENQLIAVVLTLVVVFLTGMLGGIGDVLPTDATFTLVILLVVLALVVFLLYRAIHDVLICGIVGGVGLTALVALYFLLPGCYEGLIGTILNWLDLMSRCGKIFTGVFNFSQIIFFITFTAFSLFLTVQVLEKKRWN